MNDNNVQTLYTAEDLMAMPDDDGVERYVIRGQLREDREEDVSRRNVNHSTVTTNSAALLRNWNRQRPVPRGRVLTGDAACRLRKDPDTIVGVDVMYIDAELAARTPSDAKFVDGVPTLAEEILSPSNTQEKIVGKIEDYLEAGVSLVWIADPVFRTITVYRSDAPPELFNETQKISGEPFLPGFVASVSEFFEM